MQTFKEMIPNILMTLAGLAGVIWCLEFANTGILVDKTSTKRLIEGDLRVVFRIILALSTAAVTTALPGFLEINTSYKTLVDDPIWPKIKAGGALAVFVLVYFFNPVG